MAGLVLDGAGQVKMETLNTCIALHQRIHGLVENYAISVKNNKPEKTHLNNIRRNLPILAAKLKAQFGMISDLVTAVYMSSSRGAGVNRCMRTTSTGSSTREWNGFLPARSSYMRMPHA